MNIKQTGRFLAAALLSLAAVGCQGEEPSQGDSVSTQEAASKAQCIEGFNGIRNCATGNAQLSKSEKGIAVSGLKSVKSDGIASTFPRASTWSMDAAIGGLGDTGQGLALAARDGSQVVSTLTIGMGGERDQMQLAPSFTGTPGGSQYRAYIYSGGQLQATTNVMNYDRFLNPWWWDFYWYWWPIRIGFRNHLSLGYNDPISQGACVWSLRGGPQAFSIDVNGRRVTGDEIELVEEVGDGHYPYTSFSSIEVKAAASEFTVLGEAITPAKR
ncbi:hypothetical protein [Comamonas sp. JC664]|uniref:hypothetical protein n=1 Tax=Comamonas sp. JC664 TaxID=2801917 RepID=UPI00174D94C8|nr:hypothetical protein [Comamonas sp. JC664]MBL0692325.1 hypothetical protein [Comamonas sp. JC664]GHG98557.1 hypothetical protein GCM10012319_64370 [Comamonas sp. KCTC 72670]